MNFFSQLATMMDERYKVLISVQKAGTMVIIITPVAVSEEDKKEFVPIVLRGTPSEIDAMIIPGIANPLQELLETEISGRSFLPDKIDVEKKPKKAPKETIKPVKPVKIEDPVTDSGPDQITSSDEDWGTPMDGPSEEIEELMAVEDDDLPFVPDPPIGKVNQPDPTPVKQSKPVKEPQASKKPETTKVDPLDDSNIMIENEDW
jgi:PRTRC genetic system protein E